MHEGEVSAALGMAGVPSVSESTMIARDCSLALFEDAPIHVQHLSARASVEEVARAKAAGVLITCEATPHHLTLTDEAVRSLDARFKMNPPLRSEDDRQALIDGLRDGTIDCIATDHAPHAAEEKEVPFEEAAWGSPAWRPPSPRSTRTSSSRGAAAGARWSSGLPAAASPSESRLPGSRPARRRTSTLIDPGLDLDGGGGGLREPLLQQLLRRPRAHRPRPDDGRRRPGRLPAALLRPGGRLLSGRLEADRTTLVVVDVQEAFRKAIPDFDRIAKATATLIEGAEAIGIPIVDHRAVPAGPGGDRAGGGRAPSGRTSSPWRRWSSRPPRPRASTSRAATRCSSAGSRPTSASTRRRSICSPPGSRCRWPRTPSALAPSRTSGSACRRWSGAGAVMTSVETALFELLGRAGTDEFKHVQRLILDYAPNPAPRRGRRSRERLRPARGRHPPRRRAARRRAARSPARSSSTPR